MKKGMRSIALIVGMSGMTLGMAAPAFAGPPPEEPTVRCNSGNGNGSELVNGVDCDPGKGNQPTEHNIGKD